MSKRLRLGARGSSLSLRQVELAVERLARYGIATELIVFGSTGDRDRDQPIADLPGDAPFVDDIEDGLRRRDIDVAIHSLKDMAIEPRHDLAVAAVLPRGPITESLVTATGVTLRHLPAGAVIGTSSTRRRLQIRQLRPDVICRPIRGPVDDRVTEVRSGAFDAVVFATAGLERLRLEHEIVETFAPRVFAPAAGQGAIALQVRADDVPVRALLAPIDDFSARLATDAERSVERQLDGQGHVVAAWAEVEHARVVLHVRAWPNGDADAIDVSSAGVNPESVARDASSRALDRIAGEVVVR